MFACRTSRIQSQHISGAIAIGELGHSFTELSLYLFLVLSLSETALEGSTTQVKKQKTRREHNSEIAELLLVSDSLKRRCEIKDSGQKVLTGESTETL